MNAVLLQECLRWFGPEDPVSLRDIRQCGATGVYTALHDIPYGEVWPREAIRERIRLLAEHGLRWEVVESVPVSEAIKTSGPEAGRHLENYAETLRRLGNEGVRTVIYNFMPVLDWVRTDFAYTLPTGAQSLHFDPVKFAAFERFCLHRDEARADYTAEQWEKAEAFFDSLAPTRRTAFEQSIIDVFPGRKLGLGIEQIREMLAAYQDIGEERLRQHLRQFLDAVIPAAEEAGVCLAVHPDDPPFPIMGLPRIVSTEADLRWIIETRPSPSNGICFCSGSLGARADNDLPGIVQRLGSAIQAAHLRSVQRNADGSFYEAAHLEGSVNMPAIVAELLQVNRARTNGRPLTFRPDHGHRMLDDLAKPPLQTPGYDCIGRMRGLAELRGLQLGLVAMGQAKPETSS